MKEILGIKIVKSVSLKVWAWNVLIFIMCLMIPSLIMLQVSGYMNANGSDIPLLAGPIFMIIGFLLNHIVKIYLSESYWSRSILISDLVVCLIAGLALYEKLGF